MTTRLANWKLGLVWAVSLIAVAAAASTLTWAQTTGRVVSGADLGFRIDSERNGVPTGRFVVRVNGAWVELKETVGAAKLSQ